MAHQQSQQNGDNTQRVPIPAQASSQATGDEISRALAAFWESIKRLPSYLKVAAGMARDPEVPSSAKAVLGIGGGYAISPIDLVPGIIPVAGQMDDLYVMLTALQQALKMTPAAVADRHLASVGVTHGDIDADLKAVRELVRVTVVTSLKYGGKTLGRLSRAATGFAKAQLRRRDAGRTEGPL